MYSCIMCHSSTNCSANVLFSEINSVQQAGTDEFEEAFEQFHVEVDSASESFMNCTCSS